MNDEERKQYNREYYEKNKEKVLERNRKWRNKNKDKVKTYCRKWNEANREKKRELARKWEKRSKKKISEYKREYRSKNKERLNEQAKCRIYGLSQSDLLDLMERCGGRCEICGRSSRLCIDHDHSTGKVRGILCDRCNRGLVFIEEENYVVKAMAYLNANS